MSNNSRLILDEIKKEQEISIGLRKSAFCMENVDKAMQLREKQERHYRKGIFLKELGRAMEKKKRR